MTIFQVTKGKHGGFQVTDALGRTHCAPDPSALGAVLADLIDDPDLPKPQTEAPESLAVGVIATMGRRFLPEYADVIDASRPVVSAAPTVVRALRKVIDRRATTPSPTRKNRSVRGDR